MKNTLALITNSLCSPSRAVNLTGLYNHEKGNGIASNFRPFPVNNVTHATLMCDTGYTTAYVGKWHMGTLAETLDAKLPDNAGEDSYSLMPLLKGGDKPVREYAISHVMSGLPSLRKGSWKIIFGQKGGGFEGAPGVTATGQLYDLATDLGETKNLWKEQPDLVAELTATMSRLVADGRSTPGEQQQNDVPVRWKRFLERSPPAK